MTRSRRPNKKRRRHDAGPEPGCWFCMASKTKRRILRDRELVKDRASSLTSDPA
jgi:hypothetical protein